MKSSIKFSNINHKKASTYVAMNMTAVEAANHPLGRVLPKRRSKTGSRPWVTGNVMKAEKSWVYPNVEWTEMEKTLVVAEMTRIGIIVMMNTHLFQWDGKFYLQRKGGPIGLRATCATARITMLFWDEKLDKILKDNNIGVDEGARYMDDIRLILDALQEGWRWIENGLYYSPEWEMEDKKLEETATQRTSRIMKDIMNSVLKFLNLKMEIGDDFDNKKLPTLDLEIWVQPGGRVLYQHYEKPMNTNLVIQKSSALSENTKVSSLTQEVVRVLLNCSEDLDDSSRVEYLNKLSTKIRTSGYNTLYI